MGSGLNAAEQPVREVRLTRGFFTGVYEVTQAEWTAVTGANPSQFPGDDQPVESVSWDDAVVFCKTLSEKTGKAVRLPTEAEWEYACRAGTTTLYWWGDVPDTKQMNYDGTATFNGSAAGVASGRPIAVGSYPANPWGLHDTHGNVWEWCQDGFDPVFYRSPPATTDPLNLSVTNRRVCRGGSWYTHPWSCRAANRGWHEPTGRGASFGFRVVLEGE
jgi:formylglycine-generating enzyme required for sulfatase activity